MSQVSDGRSEITGGYDGEARRSVGQEALGVTFALSRVVNIFVDAGVVARVERNGIPVGMIRLESMEEYEWLSKRINGTFDLEGTVRK